MTHDKVLELCDDLKAAVAADNPAAGGSGKLGGILKVLGPILLQILQGLLGGAKP